MSSLGSASRTACITERPPSPESNIPIGALRTDILLADTAAILEVAGKPGTDKDAQHHHHGTDHGAFGKRFSDGKADDTGKYRFKGVDENGTRRRDELLSSTS